jgi:hypothetical protein
MDGYWATYCMEYNLLETEIENETRENTMTSRYEAASETSSANSKNIYFL